MRKVSIDITNETVTAQGGCQAVDVENPLAAAGYYAVFGAVNDTGKQLSTCLVEFVLRFGLTRYRRTHSGWRNWHAHWPVRSCDR